MSGEFHDIHPLRWRRTRPFAEAVIRAADDRYVKFAVATELARAGAVVEDHDPEFFISDRAAYFWCGFRNIVAVAPELCAMLERSDAANMPLTVIRPPHSYFYIAFANSGVEFHGPLNVFEGAYVEWRDGAIMILLCCRLLERSINRRNWAQKHELTQPIYEYVREGDTVSSWCERAFQRQSSAAREDSLAAGQKFDSFVGRAGPAIRRAVELIFSSLAYLSTDPSSAAEWAPQPPMKLMQKLERGTQRQRRVVREELERLGILPIRVLGRSFEASAPSPSGDGNSVAPHWRRGHFHTYWTGPGRKVARVKWVMPIVVNASAGTPVGIHIHPLKGPK